MSVCRGAERRGASQPKGSVLIEVIVAIVILGVFLGGLAGSFQTSRGAAVRLRTQAGSLPTSLLGGRVAEAWSWGTMVDTVEWKPGPLLSVAPGVGCDGDVLVGIWSDGWLLGEWPLTAPDRLELGPSTWQGLTGIQLVLRVRKPEGYWGPPCRTVVADAYGNVAGTAAEIGSEAAPSTSFDGAFAVMHLTALATSDIETSWGAGVLTELVHNLVIALGSAGSGVCAVQSTDRTQTWIGHEGRKLDLFW